MAVKGVELGKAYVFTWVFGYELTGVAVRAKRGWVTMRTKARTFSIPIADILHEAEDQ